jgi:DNA-binding beta-propeller fold protein YncE
MSRILCALLFSCCGVAGLWATSIEAQAPTPSPLPLPNPYRVDDSFTLEMPKGLTSLGSVSSVRLGPDGNVYVFHRCVDDSCAGHDAINPILVYTPQGRLVRGLGAGVFNWPHGLLVMPDASLWALDAGAVAGVNGQVAMGSQALRLDKNGKALAMIGKPGVSAAGRDTLNKPSDIAIGRNGDIFIADGHSGGAARLVKFNSRGEYVTECGSRGAGPGQMGQPHALAIDSQWRIFLADRTNNRINIYDQDCRFLTEWKQFGRPSWVAIDRSDTIYVVDTQTTEGRAGFENGIYIGNARDGKVTGFIPRIRARSVWEVRSAGGAENTADATNMESIAVTPDGSAIYGGEVGLKTVVKFVKK